MNLIFRILLIVSPLLGSCPANGAPLPGADGFSPSNVPRKEHRIPRMRASRYPSIANQGLGNISKGPRIRTPAKVDTSLAGQRGNQCPPPNFDTKKEYKNFMDDMSEKGIKVNCDQARFDELCINPETGNMDQKSLFEAKGGLQGEGQNLYRDLERIKDPEIRADFKAKDIETGKTILVEHKGMIDFKSLEEEGKDTSSFPSHERVGYNIGSSIPKQKENYVGLPNGVESTESVLHLVNFEKIRDPLEKPALVSAVLSGAKDAGSSENIVFLNYE